MGAPASVPPATKREIPDPCVPRSGTGDNHRVSCCRPAPRRRSWLSSLLPEPVPSDGGVSVCLSRCRRGVGVFGMPAPGSVGGGRIFGVTSAGARRGGRVFGIARPGSVGGVRVLVLPSRVPSKCGRGLRCCLRGFLRRWSSLRCSLGGSFEGVRAACCCPAPTHQRSMSESNPCLRVAPGVALAPSRERPVHRPETTSGPPRPIQPTKRAPAGPQPASTVPGRARRGRARGIGRRRGARIRRWWRRGGCPPPPSSRRAP